MYKTEVNTLHAKYIKISLTEKPGFTPTTEEDVWRLIEVEESLDRLSLCTSTSRRNVAQAGFDGLLITVWINSSIYNI